MNDDISDLDKRLFYYLNEDDDSNYPDGRIIFYRPGDEKLFLSTML